MNDLKKIVLLSFSTLIFSCGSNDNVIQGLVTYQDPLTKMDTIAEGTDVYLYGSIVDRQDHPKSFLKNTTVGSSGHYSFFSLQNGPYYVYAEKLDSNGQVLYFDGTSTNVEGKQTQILDLELH